jgi:hypothetical protein
MSDTLPDHAQALHHVDASPAPAPRVRRGRGWLRIVVTVLTAQYVIVLMMGVAAALAVREMMLPQILDRFEAITAALKRTPF